MPCHADDDGATSVSMGFSKHLTVDLGPSLASSLELLTSPTEARTRIEDRSCET